MDRDVNKSSMVISVYIITAAVGCLVIIYNYINGIYYNEWFHRSTITFFGVSRDPNFVAGFIAPMPILVLSISPNSIRHALILKISLISLGIIALVLDGSRGGIVSCIIPVFLYVLFKEQNRKRRFAEFLFAGILITIGYYLIINYLPEQTIDRLLFRTSENTRTGLWKVALTPFFNNPIIGEGIGSASYYSNMIMGNYSHNMYIDILSCSGLLGSTIYLLFMVENLKSGCRLKDCFNSTLGLVFLALFLPQFFINGFNTVSMWLPLIMIHHTNVVLINTRENPQIVKTGI